jgi:hypothetical protein
MTTYILSIADPHWTEKTPRSRKDDFKQAQTNKIQALVKLAEHLKLPGSEQKGAAAVTIAGDLFHQPEAKQISRKLETWLIPELRKFKVPVIVIPGNHDMKAHRMASLEEHPYGVLTANDVVKQVIWPGYMVVGSDPPVIVVGKEFHPSGPKPWLVHLQQTEELLTLRKAVKDRMGVEPQVLAQTHCWWGPADGINRGEPLVGYDNIKDTGIDIMIYGHPHSLDGVMQVQDSRGQSFIVGPGAFIRGTLAEHDTKREPKISISIFENDGTHRVMLVSVPHQPADVVFNFEKHTRMKKEVEVRAQFVKELGQVEGDGQTLEDIFTKAAESSTPPEVIARARQYITQAEGVRS